MSGSCSKKIGAARPVDPTPPHPPRFFCLKNLAQLLRDRYWTFLQIHTTTSNQNQHFLIWCNFAFSTFYLCVFRFVVFVFFKAQLLVDRTAHVGGGRQFSGSCPKKIGAARPLDPAPPHPPHFFCFKKSIMVLRGMQDNFGPFHTTTSNQNQHFLIWCNFAFSTFYPLCFSFCRIRLFQSAASSRPCSACWEAKCQVAAQKKSARRGLLTPPHFFCLKNLVQLLRDRY